MNMASGYQAISHLPPSQRRNINFIFLTMRAQSTAELLSAEQFLLMFDLWDIFIDCLQSCVVPLVLPDNSWYIIHLPRLAIHPSQSLCWSVSW